MTAPADSKRVEVLASDLTYPEWFFLWAAFGQKPDANLKHSSEWHKRSLGMGQAEKLLLFRQGMEGLMSRGLIVPDTDKDGVPRKDPSGQPIFKGAGRIVSQVTSVAPLTH